MMDAEFIVALRKFKQSFGAQVLDMLGSRERNVLGKEILVGSRQFL